MSACLVLVAAAPARAEDARSAVHTPPPAALEHYNRGRAHYQAGRYREAVLELEAALELDPGSPNLVYNLARVFELLGEIDPALSYYERYRDMLPGGELEERARVDTTIERLRGARKLLSQRPEPQLRPMSVVARTRRGVADGAFWTFASLSLAALVTGGVTGGLALRESRAARGFVLGRDGDLAALNEKAEHADRLALSSDVSIAVGAIGGLTSILLYALRTETFLEPQVALGSQGFVLGLRGSL